MSGMLPSLYAMMGFMILASIVAIEAKDLLSTVISVSAAGAALSIIFLMMGAPDLAITQVVVEVLCLVLLIRMTLRRDDTTYDRPRDIFSVATGLVFGGMFLAVCAYCFQMMVPFGRTLMTTARPYLLQGLAGTGAANQVTAVLLDFRAYDTLGEATVIFAAVIGAYAILRKVGRIREGPHGLNDTTGSSAVSTGQGPATRVSQMSTDPTRNRPPRLPDRQAGMTLIVKQVTKLVAGFIALFSAYIILYGHLTPGGGFVGGVILACGFILLVLAFGKELIDRLVGERAPTIWDCLGALGFLGLAVLGYVGGQFFMNFLPHPGNFKLVSAGMIPLANIAIGIKVAACLFGVFIALAVFRSPTNRPSSRTDEESKNA